MEEKKVSLRLSHLENTYEAQTSSGKILVGEGALSPVELVLVALGGCSGVDVSNILKKKRQKVKDIRIEVVGERREEHPRVYKSIKLKYIVIGEDVSRKAVEDAVRLSLKKYCSVYTMLREAVNIDVEMDVWEEKG
ncbi:MAG: OsmC family protein [Aquificaceae bacterium]